MVILSQGDDSEESEIEEIITEGAMKNIVQSHPPPPPPQAAAALKAEMNKVEVAVGMYQVVQRFEHISTTTAVVPRYPATASDQQVGHNALLFSCLI